MRARRRRSLDGTVHSVYGADVSAVMRGRQAEAARNHERLMSAAREVLAATPDAPMAHVASHAGVGVATLYRRYASRDALVAETWLESVREVQAQARVALDRAGMFPWGAFVGFMTASVASGMGALAAALAQTAAPTEDLIAAERSMNAAIGSCWRSPRRPVRCAPTSASRTCGCSSSSCTPCARRTRRERRRCAGATSSSCCRRFARPGAAPLPGPAPAAAELRGRYDTR